MEFNRSPRIQETIEYEEIYIPAPKSLPGKPKVNWLTLGLPLVGTMLAVGLMVTFFGATSGLSIVLFLPMIVASAAASVITNSQERKDYDKLLAEEKAAYIAVLTKKKNELGALLGKQKRILENNNPDQSVCLDWVQKKYFRLGERRPEDVDFLTFRFGIGKQKAELKIVSPSEDGRDKAYKDEYVIADDLKPQFSEMTDVPITTSLLSVGCIGIAGPRDRCRDLARASLIHLASHHWPAEMHLAVLCDSIMVSEQWKWVSNLPHRTQLFQSSATVDVTGQNKFDLEALEKELYRRQALLCQENTADKEKQQSSFLPAIVMIFDHLDAIYDQAAFSLILNEGRNLGMYGIILVDRFEDIPGECGATIEFNGNTLIYKEVGLHKIPVKEIIPDDLPITEVEKFVTAFSTIEWLLPTDVTEPPSHVSLLELFGVSEPDNLQIEKSWDGDYMFKYLRAPIGRFTPTADLIFDLNESSECGETHGPHGVIGGMTGSGKSILLRSIILSLALTHHPYDVNFALIDYKGGGAFKDLEDLPHVVGVTTDIENHTNYAGRVIQALTGEINIRKLILSDACHNSGLTRAHIDDYRHLDIKRPLPRLIIIFDEFAEFKDQHPDESRKLINIARQGRSLGVHLILCTQNPAAAIDDQVRQNSKFTISLGVNSPDDSRNLIGIPDAFGLIPGLAYMYVKSPQKFRVGYPEKILTSGQYAGKTEAQAIVEKLKAISRKLGLDRPPRVWPDPLLDRLYLPVLLKNLEESGISTAWDDNTWNLTGNNSFGYLLGRYDDPSHQRQPLFIFGSPGSNQHLLIFGSSRSGKSTLLLTLAIGIARVNTPAQAHIYCLDLGGQSPLYKLKDLPHVAEEGGVISANDPERINSLFSLMRKTMHERMELFRLNENKSTDFNDYNQKCSDSSQCLPAIYILIDGLTSHFTESMDSFNDQLAEVILGGQSVGISVAITAPVSQDIQYKIFSYITSRIILRPVEKNQVDSIIQGIPSNLLDLMLAQGFQPGRGLLGGYPAREFQTALPVSGIDDEEQSYHLNDLITRMNASWSISRPPNVPFLPRYLSVEDLQEGVDRIPPIDRAGLPNVLVGLGRDNKPLGFSLENDGPAFLVTSSLPGQGKTDFLLTWITGLTEKRTPAQLKLMLLDFQGHTLRNLGNLPHIPDGWFVSRQNQLEPALISLRKEITTRNHQLETIYTRHPEEYSPDEFLKDNGYIVVVVDNYTVFRLKNSMEAKALLNECIVLGEECGIRFVIAGTSVQLGYPSADEFLLKITQSGCGISLGGFESLENYFNQAKVMLGQKTTDFPLGRGYLVNRGIGRLVQFATYCPQGADHTEMIKKRVAYICSRTRVGSKKG